MIFDPSIYTKIIISQNNKNSLLKFFNYIHFYIFLDSINNSILPSPDKDKIFLSS